MSATIHDQARTERFDRLERALQRAQEQLVALRLAEPAGSSRHALLVAQIDACAREARMLGTPAGGPQ